MSSVARAAGTGTEESCKTLAADALSVSFMCLVASAIDVGADVLVTWAGPLPGPGGARPSLCSQQFAGDVVNHR